MLKTAWRLAGLTILLAASSTYTHGQQAVQSRQLQVSKLRSSTPINIHANAYKGLTQYGATKSFGKALNAGLRGDASSGIPGIDSIINWSDQFFYNGYDGAGNPQSVWPYTMVGRPPESGRTTHIRAPVVPVTVELLGPDGKVALTFGPDGQVIQNVLQSPEFVPNRYTNGFGQFNDQQFRAEFANRLFPGDNGNGNGNDNGNGNGNGNDNDNGWHTILQPVLRTARTIQVPFLTATGTNAWYYFVNSQGQPVLAAIDYNTFGSLLFPSTYPFNSSTPVGAAELAGDITTHDTSTFLFNNTVLFVNGNINDCCVIGYHTYDFEPGIPQNGNLPRLYVLNYSSWLSPGLFLFGFQDITPWSHEMAETFNDPFINNATPWWLSVDPFTGGGICQNNLEVGDVIEVLDSLNPVSTIPGKGLTYHPQNVALFPWFAFESPSPAHLGAYSFPDETTLMTLSPGPLLPGCVEAP
jgi:hypothetical protein